jgi:hypothetical protein
MCEAGSAVPMIINHVVSARSACEKPRIHGHFAPVAIGRPHYGSSLEAPSLPPGRCAPSSSARDRRLDRRSGPSRARLELSRPPAPGTGRAKSVAPRRPLPARAIDPQNLGGGSEFFGPAIGRADSETVRPLIFLLKGCGVAGFEMRMGWRADSNARGVPITYGLHLARC